MADEDQILYESSDKVAVITLNRPHRANAQTMALLDDLNAAFERAADDDDVRVIVLRANGKHFSAGHDLSGGGGPAPDKITLERIYALETRKYLEYSLRWRNIPKPTIASVQGKAIAGALLLVWPMDLIVAAENAEFSDPVVFMGIGGVEYHGHTWEFGPRKAKEILSSRWSPSRRRQWPSPVKSPRTTPSACARPSARSTRPSTSRASTRRYSRSSTSTRRATVTRYPSPATRSSPAWKA
jgi:enoyl-CoA hydratase/carnithine racemase